MTEKNLDKALEIVSVLINGGEIKKDGKEASLYEEYAAGGEVYDGVVAILKKFNLSLYEYNYGLYITAGENNKIFGYTNDDLKKQLGLRLNRELYLCYFIIYSIMTRFYKTGNVNTFVDYVRPEEVVDSVNSLLSNTIGELQVLNMDEIEEASFKEIALVWEDMPMVITEESALRASRGSKAGFVKLVLNFLLEQDLFIESEGRYYPKDRFRALMENYYTEYKGRLYQILEGEE